MEAEASGDAPMGVAHRVLEKQEQLIGWEIAERRAGLALRVLIGVAGLAVAVGLALMAWQASRADGVVIRPFSVSPQMAAQGVTGEVLAGELLDHINLQLAAAASTAMQRSTSIAGSSGEDLRLEIPETGISIDELYRALRGWLGHERSITGAMTQTGDIITLTARYADQPAVTVSGPADDRAAMVRSVAEKILARADPIRAVFFLRTQNRTAEVDAILTELRSVGTPSDRAGGFSFTAAGKDDPGERLRYAREAVAIDPSIVMAYQEISVALIQLGRWEEALATGRTLLTRLATSKSGMWGENGWERVQHNAAARQADLLGDYTGAYAEAEASGNILQAVQNVPSEAALIPRAVLAHDIGGAQRLLDRATLRSVDPASLRDAQALVDLAAERWPQAAESLAALLADPATDTRRLRLRRTSDLAVAKARGGDVAGAAAVIDPTPMDCYPCLLARGIVAVQAGDPSGADRWFGFAVRAGPSLPQAQAEWARVLLDRGNLRGAIAKASAAAAKGPRFADPLEVWGEALLAQGDARAAGSKFKAAAKLAPRWGRLHLKWGEALAKLGKADEARAKWRAAAAMDLSAADRAALKAHGV